MLRFLVCCLLNAPITFIEDLTSVAPVVKKGVPICIHTKTCVLMLLIFISFYLCVCVCVYAYNNHCTGRPVAQSVEQVPHIQRLCPCCSGPRFDSTCGPLLHVIPPLSPLFSVHSSAVTWQSWCGLVMWQGKPSSLLLALVSNFVNFRIFPLLLKIRAVSRKWTTVEKKRKQWL